MLLCIIPQTLVAQKQKPKNLPLYDEKLYHFGFIVALNNMSYAINYRPDYQKTLYMFSDHPNVSVQPQETIDELVKDGDFDDSERMFYDRGLVSAPSYGFTVGIVGNLRLGRYFDLRLIPSLSFGAKNMTYDYHIIWDEDFDNIREYHKNSNILATIMEFPLHIKYKSKRHDNIAAYIIGGGNPKLDFSFVFTSDKQRIQAKTFDFAAEIGAGFDYYTSHFKFGVEAKMSFGLINVLDKHNNQYDSSIDGLKNRMFQVSLTFE